MKISHLCIILILLAGSAPIRTDDIINYRTYFAECGNDAIALRRFTRNGTDYLVTVNPATLRTSIGKARQAHCKAATMDAIKMRYNGTFFIKALRESKKNAASLQNAGFTHFLPSEKGINLTVDLCPSRHPFDRLLITTLLNEFGKIEHPVPLGLSITGVWMENHGNDILWLKNLEKRKMISPTWINHSYNHRFSKKLPLRKNFLLEKDTVIEYEVLATEKKMIESGLLPSVFFRFPGLISNLNLVEKITAFGLISLGSDAWLGKRQWPKGGSIVLVHATGNEPIGIVRFINLIKSKRNEIINKHWFLYDLRESVSNYERSSR